jgi:hypothetical protein
MWTPTASSDPASAKMATDYFKDLWLDLKVCVVDKFGACLGWKKCVL